MRRVHVLVAVPVLALAFHAGCVGDDPTASGASNGGQDAASDTDTGVTSDASTGDAAPDAETADAGDAGPPCRLDLPFGTPALVPGVNTADTNKNSLRARVSHDELALYFASDRDGSYAIYVATRSARTAAFGSLAVTKVEELSAAGDAWDPALTDTGATIYFASRRTGGKGGFDIWTASRTSATTPYGSITNVSIVDSTDDDAFPFVTGDGKELWFSSYRGGGVNVRIYQATGGPAFTSAGLPVGLGVTTGDWAPYLTSDGRTLYFASDRPGGSGSRDIWVAERALPNDPFNAPTNVPGVNSSGDEHPGSLSADGCRIYFDSNRSGSWAIYMAERPTH